MINLQEKNIITENETKILKTESVFYNTAQVFNRSISIEIINAYLKYMNKNNLFKNHKSVNILECMAASGIRSLRYIREISRHELVDKNIIFHINDISSESVKLIKTNFLINHIEISEDIKIIQSDCRELMIKSTCKYNIIDLDPFGSAVPYLQPAFNAIKHNGLMLITCTDTAVLCSNPTKCYVKYGNIIPKFIAGGFKSKDSIIDNINKQNGSLDRSRCHSLSLRALLNHISKAAAVEGCAIEPLISISVDYYVRVAIRVIRNSPDVRKSFKRNSFVGFCIACGHYKKIPFNSIFSVEDDSPCSINVQNLILKSTEETNFKCQYRINGPFWTDVIQNKAFLDLMNEAIQLKYACPRIASFIRIIHGEAQIETAALFDYSIPEICSYLAIDCIPLYSLLSKLKNLGFAVALSHCILNGFVSSASFRDIIRILYDYKKTSENGDIKTLFKTEEWNNKEVGFLITTSPNRQILFGKEGPMSSPKRK
ncbi:tRNA (guanine(26)-N(2))-dimethyltransferase [Cucumispora dikerogammari]|nr:tRNA (guanine(26)-N(2))-dimethyltransferase [Cucumispora dikerogammari]